MPDISLNGTQPLLGHTRYPVSAAVPPRPEPSPSALNASRGLALCPGDLAGAIALLREVATAQLDSLEVHCFEEHRS